jgi:hypothetical protein
MRRRADIAVIVEVLMAGGYVFFASCSRQEAGPLTADGCGALWQFEHEVIDPNPPARTRINDLQIGDLDGDGAPDIWTTGRTADGSGASLYQMVWYKGPEWKRHEIAKGDYKYGTLLDIDQDGDRDVVASRYWFENTGVPEEKDWPRYELGYEFEPDLVHAADIDADGRPDLVITTKNDLYWLLNPSNPKMAWERVHLASDSKRRTGGAVADLDRDGDLDVLWGNAWYEHPDDPKAVPWSKRVIDARWPAEARGAVGDVNGDGRDDVVLSGEESEAGIAWYEAPPDPAARRWTRHDVMRKDYEGLHSLVLADFDRDGDLDIFTAEMHHGDNPDKVAVFENLDPGGNLWAEHLIDTTGSHNARVADVDGDGYPDIVGKNYEAGESPLRIDLWKNNIPNSPLAVNRWMRHVIDEDRGSQALFIDSGDLNGDSLPDIVSGDCWYENPGMQNEPWTRRTIGGTLYQAGIVYDFDNDGDLDILGTTGRIKSDQFVWAANRGEGTFDVHDNLPRGQGDFLQGVRAARLVPGGPVEVLLSWHNETSTQKLQVPPDATAPWLWSIVSPTTNGEQVALADVDGDSDLDVHLGTRWLRNDGDAWAPIEAFTMGDPEADPDRVELADMDLDGDLDAVIGAEHADRLVWAECPADPETPWIEHVISTDILAMSVDVADLDGDGDPDVVAGEHNTERKPDRGRVIIYRNNDKGQSWASCVIDRGREHHDGTRFVDIDKDGDLDIISIGYYHNQVVLYQNGAKPMRRN